MKLCPSSTFRTKTSVLSINYLKKIGQPFQEECKNGILYEEGVMYNDNGLLEMSCYPACSTIRDLLCGEIIISDVDFRFKQSVKGALFEKHLYKWLSLNPLDL